MPERHEEVVCPFCSLACDDLVVEAEGASLRVVANGCPISVPAFARPVGDATPRVGGQPASLEAAVERAANLLASSRLPLFAGLGTDTAGTRAALALAEAAGGIVDHAAAAGQLANIRVTQDAGWVTATLAEARNRPDLMLFVGTDTTAVAPRLLERLLRPGPRLVERPERRLVFLGAVPPEGVAAEHIPCPPERLPLVLAWLEGAVMQRRLPDVDPAVAALGQRLREASYSLIVWAAGEMEGPHADLLVGRLAAVLRELNATTRAAGLPLAGFDNIVGVNQAVSWQVGTPLRTSLASGAPDFDPWRYTTDGAAGRGGGRRPGVGHELPRPGAARGGPDRRPGAGRLRPVTAGRGAGPGRHARARPRRQRLPDRRGRQPAGAAPARHGPAERGRGAGGGPPPDGLSRPPTAAPAGCGAGGCCAPAAGGRSRPSEPRRA